MNTIRKLITAALLLALGVEVPAARAQADSEAQSKGSDWFGSSSGWVKNSKQFLGGSPPTGNWQFEYKHWFDSSPEPAWATRSTWEKPVASEWPTSPSWARGEDALTTTDPHTSTATSQWELDYWRTPLCGNFNQEFETRSLANARGSNSERANSKTRIVDPWIFARPGSGPWSVGGATALAGSLATGVGGVARFRTSYYIAYESTSFADAFLILRVDVGAHPGEVDVWAHSNLNMYRGDFVQVNGEWIEENIVDLSVAEVESDLSEYYSGPYNWALDGSTFGPDSAQWPVQGLEPMNGLSAIYLVELSYFLPASASSASLFRIHESQASAALCGSDFDLDGNVGITDFLTLLSAWGTEPWGPPDLDGNCVGVTDMLIMLGNWGPCPPQDPAQPGCPGPESCFVPHATPGCQDPQCCLAVCDINPFCCDVQWDVGCVGQAQQACQHQP